MHQKPKPSFLQTMACCFFLVSSHYLNECWNIVNWTLGNKLQWNFNQNSYIFIQENVFENVVWKMAAILSQPQCVETILHCIFIFNILLFPRVIFPPTLCIAVLKAITVSPTPSPNSPPPGQNGCHFTDNIFRCIFVNEKLCFLIKISLKFIPKGPIDNNPAFV